MVSAEEIRQIVRDTMQEQQAALLMTAEQNTRTLLEEESRNKQAQVLNTIDEEIERTQTLDTNNYTWKNNINKSNFNHMKQVHDLWEKTERAIKSGQIPKAMEIVEKGKRLSRDRLKVFRFADRDGWDSAMLYLSDDLADDEKDERRMKKSKKTAANLREAKLKRLGNAFKSRGKEALSPPRFSTSKTYGQKPNYSDNRNSRYRGQSETDTKTCWVCGKFGHLSKHCRRAYYKREQEQY